MKGRPWYKDGIYWVFNMRKQFIDTTLNRLIPLFMTLHDWFFLSFGYLRVHAQHKTLLIGSTGELFQLTHPHQAFK